MQPDEQEAPVVRLNARDTDAFDLGNLTYFPGPNVYLPRAALVFDLALTGGPHPLAVADYVEAVAKVYPHLTGTTFPDHAHLFAGLVSLVSRLDIGLHLDRFSVHPRGRFDRVATQALDRRTQHRAVYFVWDWLEAIGAGTPFDHAAGMAKLQALFNRSPFGGPTTYALLRTADARGIPTVYRRDEGLMQYGYGRRQVRGVSTTFSTDSQLDSDFTTRKDDCKAFLGRLGFPVPKGDVVSDLDDALAAAEEIGFPVAVKPLDGHKGIGVTANVRDAEELRAAFARAGGGDGAEIIVETSLAGSDFRLLCVNGRFVAGLERRPPWVEGDGVATLDQLIERENATPGRADSPVSPMSKIIKDEAMIACIEQQGYTRQSIPAAGATVWLRKVANLSAGGVSIDVTPTVHVDNVILAQEVARQFRLTCMGIDVMAVDLARSWKEGALRHHRDQCGTRRLHARQAGQGRGHRRPRRHSRHLVRPGPAVAHPDLRLQRAGAGIDQGDRRPGPVALPALERGRGLHQGRVRQPLRAADAQGLQHQRREPPAQPDPGPAPGRL